MDYSIKLKTKINGKMVFIWKGVTKEEKDLIPKHLIWEEKPFDPKFCMNYQERTGN